MQTALQNWTACLTLTGQQHRVHGYSVRLALFRQCVVVSSFFLIGHPKALYPSRRHFSGASARVDVCALRALRGLPRHLPVWHGNWKKRKLSRHRLFRLAHHKLFTLGLRAGRTIAFDPASSQYRQERCAESCIAIVQHVATLIQISASSVGRVAGHLLPPKFIRMPRDTGQAHRRLSK